MVNIAPILAANAAVIAANSGHHSGANVSNHDAGVFLLAAFGYMVYVAFWFWLSEKYFDMSFGVILFGSIGIPLLVGGFLLL